MTGTYVKLADAYAAEKEEIGNFEKIGYVPPGQKTGSSWATNTFKYSETFGGADVNEVWTATANGKMNDYDSGSTWTVTTTKTAASAAALGTLSHVVAIDGSGCETLTPSFTSIGNAAAAGSGS